MLLVFTVDAGNAGFCRTRILLAEIMDNFRAVIISLLVGKFKEHLTGDSR